MTFIRHVTVVLFPLIALFLPFLTGCSTLSLDSPSDARVDSLGTTSASLRYQLINVAYYFSATVESASDSITKASDNQEVHKNAMMWKIYAIPRSRQALLHPDPLAGMYDGWAFAIQMRNYFEQGNGSELFGSLQPIAIRAARRLTTLFSTGMTFISDSLEYQRMIEAVEQWAANHPNTDLHFNRPSIVPKLATLVPPEDKTAITALGEIAQNVDDLALRLNLYAAQTPTEARWQAEYLLMELDAERKLDSLAGQSQRLLRTFDDLTQVLVSGDLAIDIKSLRLLHDDIELFITRVRAERELAFQETNRQRMETLNALDSLAARSILQASAISLHVVDHLIVRVLQILGILVLLAIALFALRALLRKR